MGNLKIDAPLTERDVPESWARNLEGTPGPLIVAGSTHRGENRLLLDAFRGLRSHYPAARLIIAPRHLDRAADIRTRSADLRVVQWSEGPDPQWDVLVVDISEFWRPSTPGRTSYSSAAVWFKKGGHNPLEAAAVGRAIVVGPHYDHFREVVEELSGEGALHILRSAEAAALQVVLDVLLSDPARRVSMARRAKRFVDENRGVADRYRKVLMERFSSGSSSGRASTGTARETPESGPPWPDSSAR